MRERDGYLLVRRHSTRPFEVVGGYNRAKKHPADNTSRSVINRSREHVYAISQYKNCTQPSRGIEEATRVIISLMMRFYPFYLPFLYLMPENVCLRDIYIYIERDREREREISLRLRFLDGLSRTN